MKIFAPVLRMLFAPSLLMVLSSQLSAQGDTVDVIGTYTAGRTPTVLVLPVDMPNGDSIRAILQRDLDYGSRVIVNTRSPELRLPARGDFPYEVFAGLLIDEVIHAIPSMTGGLQVRVYSVRAKQLRREAEFPLPAAANSPDWRMAVHTASDNVQDWIVGEMGVAASRISFVRDGSIYLIDFDGANERLFERLESGSGPTWSPTGDAIAFSGLRGTARQIGVRGTGAADRTRWLTNENEGDCLTPAFSPDGKELYYSYYNGSRGNLWVVPVSGTGANRTITREQVFNSMYPSTNPDGSRVVFASSRQGRMHPHLINKDGTEQKVLFEYQRDAKTRYFAPQWSPDGTRILFTAEMAGGQSQIQYVSLRELRPVALTDLGYDEDASWSPTSKHIVFKSRRTGEDQLWIMDLESGFKRQLTHVAGSKQPDWSPRLRRVP